MGQPDFYQYKQFHRDVAHFIRFNTNRAFVLRNIKTFLETASDTDTCCIMGMGDLLPQYKDNVYLTPIDIKEAMDINHDIQYNPRYVNSINYETFKEVMSDRLPNDQFPTPTTLAKNNILLSLAINYRYYQKETNRTYFLGSRAKPYSSFEDVDWSEWFSIVRVRYNEVGQFYVVTGILREYFNG